MPSSSARPIASYHFVETVERDGAGVDRLPAGRLLAQLGNFHVAEVGEHQRARDRRRGQHQHVHGLALAGERKPLVHAEAMLLVDDGEREIAECDLVLEQRVGADQQIDLAECEAVERVGALLAAFAAGQDRDANAGLLGQRRDGGEMLARQDFGRRHQRGLAAGLDHGRGGEQRHHGLAGADVALQQPDHAVRLRQIGDDVVDGAALRRRQRIGQGGDHLGAQQALAGAAAARQLALVRANQRQRELAGEQFVIGEPRPGLALRQDVGRARPGGAGCAARRRRTGSPARCSQAGSCHSGSFGIFVSAASAALRTGLSVRPSVSG